MAILANYFNDALSNIEPNDDVANAIKAHTEVRNVLLADKRLKDLGINPVLIGSYARDVSIKRVKDVDVFIRLDAADDRLLPSTALNLCEEILIKHFREDRVHRQDRSIKVDFLDYKLTVDAVPARPCGDHWEIPNHPEEAERAQWVETDPERLTKLTQEMNGKEQYQLHGNGVYVPTVKLIRQVRRTWVEDHPGGLFFEIMTYWAFEGGDLSAGSIPEYLTQTLEQLADMLPTVAEDGLEDPTLPDETISTKAEEADFEQAIEGIQKAAKLARAALDEDDDCKSAVMWRQLLGVIKGEEDSDEDDEYVFPLPSYCNTDGTRKNSATITRGAPAVPAGSDRYA
jgi:hypothetical protein